MAPEVMVGDLYTEKIDVYSFGILLTELVTRQMPFHDMAKISSYMDVVDLVLDQGAIPTIPKWCENLLGGLIRQCLSRVPGERPNFTDLIMKLREVADLDDSIYFFAFDLPRLRELMMSSNPSIQALAASEVAALLSASHIRRRSTPADAMGSPTMAGVASPIMTPTPTSTTSTSASHGLLLSPPSNVIPTLTLPSPVVTSPISPSPLPLSPSTPCVTVGGLTSPLLPASSSSLSNSSRQPHVEGDYWILSNEDAFDFLERFTGLLSSSHREVQLQSCRALRSLLQLSSHDRLKRAQDRELVIQNGGLMALLTLLMSPSLSIAAGDVLLLLTEDLSPSEQSALIGLDHLGLAELSRLVSQDISEEEEQLREVQARIDRKRGMLSVIDQCARQSATAAAASSDPSNKLLKKPTRRTRAAGASGRNSMTPIKFNPGLTVLEESEPVSGGTVDGETDEDDENDQRISEQLLVRAASLRPKGHDDDDDDGGGWNVGRARAETAQRPRALTSSMRDGELGGPRESVSVSTNDPNPTTPMLVDKFVGLNVLLDANEPPTEKFTDWYSNIVLAQWTLRYDLEGDLWELCYTLLLPDELRLFNDRNDEPDEPSYIIRTRVIDPDSDDGKMIPAKVRVGHKHGMPFCFQVEDCGRIWTFCSGSSEQQEKWKKAITGEESAAPTSTNSADATMDASAAVAPSISHPASSSTRANATALPAFSLSLNKSTPEPSSAANAALANANANPFQLKSPHVTAKPLGPHVHHPAVIDDPTLAKDIPHLELPTPPFAKRFREITYHGYLYLKDRMSQQWILRYLILVGTTLRVFESHRSSPNEPIAEHEVRL